MRIAELERALADQRVKVTTAAAKLRGLEAELDALRSGMADRRELAAMPRTEAILVVLRAAEGTLSPTEILAQLQAGGASTSVKVVTATLDHLLKNGSVRRPERGRYLAL